MSWTFSSLFCIHCTVTQTSIDQWWLDSKYQEKTSLLYVEQHFTNEKDLELYPTYMRHTRWITGITHVGDPRHTDDIVYLKNGKHSLTSIFNYTITTTKITIWPYESIWTVRHDNNFSSTNAHSVLHLHSFISWAVNTISSAYNNMQTSSLSVSIPLHSMHNFSTR